MVAILWNKSTNKYMYLESVTIIVTKKLRKLLCLNFKTSVYTFRIGSVTVLVLKET